MLSEIVFFAFAVAACGARAQSAPIKPGLWEIHSDREVNGQKAPDTSDRIKSLSPEKRARYEAMMKEHGIAADNTGPQKVCYTRENLNESFWASMATDCKATFASRSATFWKWHTSCPKMSVEADGESYLPQLRNLHSEVSLGCKNWWQGTPFDHDIDRQVAGPGLWRFETSLPQAVNRRSTASKACITQ